MTRFVRFAWLTPVLLTLVACPGGGPSRFGAVLPLTGPAAVYGTSIRRGIDLAVEELQKEAKAPRIAITVVDSGSDPERAKQQLDKLYDDGSIAVIGGVTSAEALAMVKVADQAERILLSPSASLPQLTGISSNFFRIFPSDFAEGTVMAKYSVDSLRMRTAVILAKKETYAKGIQEVFADEFQRKGGEIMELIEFPANTGDFAGLADRAVTLRPDCVYVAAYADEISRIIQELRSHQFPGLILTTSSFATAETIAKTGAAAEGVLYTQTAFDLKTAPTERVKTFATAFRAKYGMDPDLYAAHGYDAVLVLAEALRQGGTTGTSFWKGMRGVREFPGVTGSLQFDEKGDVQKFPRVYTISGGRAMDRELDRQRQLDEARKKIQEIEDQLRRMQQQGN